MSNKKNRVQPQSGPGRKSGAETVGGTGNEVENAEATALVDEELREQEKKVEAQKQRVETEKRKKETAEQQRKQKEEERKEAEQRRKQERVEREQQEAAAVAAAASAAAVKAEKERLKQEQDMKKREEQLEKDKKKAEADRKKKEAENERKRKEAEERAQRDAEAARRRREQLQKDLGAKEAAIAGGAVALAEARERAKQANEERKKAVDELTSKEKKLQEEEEKVKKERKAEEQRLAKERKEVIKEKKKKTPTVATTCCMKTIKYSIVVINAIFIAVGLGLLGFGLYLRLDQRTMALLGSPDISQVAASATDPFFMLTYGVMGLGVFVVIICAIGLAGALNENDIFLFVFAAVTLIISLGLLGLGIVPLASRQTLFLNDMQELVESLVFEEYGTSSTARTVTDWIQENLKCCGAASPSDWTNSTWYNSSVNSNNNTRPNSCYDDPQTRSIPYTDGCSKKLEDYANDYFLYIGIGFIAVGALILITVTCSCVLCNRIRTFKKHGHDVELVKLEAKQKAQEKEIEKLKKDLAKIEKA